MQTVVPFRAWRYGPAAGDLSRLIAPPYDVIGPDLQSRLYASSRHNVVRVDLGMSLPSDNECDNRYTRAAAQLGEWRRKGILVRDPKPSLTFVEESFTGPDGLPRVRHGFLAAMRLHDFDEGIIFPHEQTLSGPKEDRFRLMKATAMSLSPVFLLYDLPGDDITTAWMTRLGAETPVATVTSEEGTVTKLWPTSDAALLGAAERHLADARFIIADGHHRYETALRYQRDAGRDTAAKADGSRHASDYALAYFGNMADPGLAIYGTHRLLSGLDPGIVAALPDSLSDTFSVERIAAAPAAPSPAGSEGAERAADTARAAITAFLDAHSRGAFGLWGPGLDGAYGVHLADGAIALSRSADRSLPYQQLDVTILQTLILESGLGLTAADMAAERFVTYLQDPSEAFRRLAAGDFQVGLFMNPTGLDQIREVAFSGERMPQKATFFHPKPPTGLVFHDLSGIL